jgi:ADP-ribosylation factor GTPase-activating protein 2/3
MYTAAPSTVGGGFKKKGGAKKITKVIDFEAAARQAEQEAERALQQKELDQSRATNSSSSTMPSSTPYSSQPSFNSFNHNKPSFTEKRASTVAIEPPVPEFKKFGFGVDPSTAAPQEAVATGIGHKQINATSQPTTAPTGFGGGFGSFPPQSNESESAAKKFGNAKSISSDMYFGREQYNEAAK